MNEIIFFSVIFLCLAYSHFIYFITIIIILFFKYFSVRGCRPGKTVQLTEAEVRGLCLKSREIFLSQPILLELEAPLKICGKMCYLLEVLMYYLVEFKQ